MRIPGHPLKLGDRVTCPAVDEIPGTVVEVGYNGYTKVEYDDGQVGMTTADQLKRSDEPWKRDEHGRWYLPEVSFTDEP